MTETDPVVTWLNSLAPADACDKIEDCIFAAVAAHDVEAVPGLIVLMCRYDPHRADRLRTTLLEATKGKVTMTFDLRGNLPA